MKKTTNLRALVLSVIVTLGLVMPMAAQNDGFFKNNNEDIYGNRSGEPVEVTGSGITNQQFGQTVPVGSGLLIMVAAGAGYAVARRKRARKGMTLLLAVAMLLGMTQCKKKIETVTSGSDGLVHITLKVDNNSKYNVITTAGDDLGKVVYTDGDEIYVVNGGQLIGVLEYNGSTNQFEGPIGFDVFNYDDDDPSSLVIVPLSTEDYLHFCFVGNAALDIENGALVATIKGQKRDLPVLSCGHTPSFYETSQTDFTCELLNKCALVKFNFNSVNALSGIAGDDEVMISGVLTKAILGIGENGWSITPDQTSTGAISLYHPSGSDANERWAILLPQSGVSNKNMLIRNWLYRSNVNITTISNNDLKEVDVDCSGTPERINFFTVRQGQKAIFSPGNLQYRAAGDTTGYRFAKHQWDYVGGTDNSNNSWGNVYTKIDTVDVKCENNNIRFDYNGWIDLFGYGTGNNPTQSSSEIADYATYNDWGDYVNFNDGIDWYAPNAAEWLCLINYRPNDDAAIMGYQDDIRVNKCGPATVHGIEGLVLLPDYFEWPTEYPQADFTPKTYGIDTGWADYDVNTFTDTQWTAMETNGAVFMPAAGLREPKNDNTNVYIRPNSESGWKFFYWSRNPYWSNYEANLFTISEAPGLIPERNYDGGAVRLIHEFVF